MILFNNKYMLILTLFTVIFYSNVKGQKVNKLIIEKNDSLNEIKKINSKKIQIIGLKDSSFWAIRTLYITNDTIIFSSRYSIDENGINTNYKSEDFNYGCDCYDTTITINLKSITYLGVRSMYRNHYYSTILHLQRNAMNYVAIPGLSIIAGLVVLIGGEISTGGTLLLVGGGILMIGIIKGYRISILKEFDLEKEWKLTYPNTI